MSDSIYTQQFGSYITKFMSITNGEMNIQTLLPVLVQLQESSILNLLMIDPKSDQAINCLDTAMQTTRIPVDFKRRFLSLCSLKLNLIPNSSIRGVASYNVKVSLTAVTPTRNVTSMTIKNRQADLISDIKNAQLFDARNSALPPQSIRAKFDESIIERCINAMDDLNKTIVEGNRSNGWQMDPYFSTTDI